MFSELCMVITAVVWVLLFFCANFDSSPSAGGGIIREAERVPTELTFSN